MRSIREQLIRSLRVRVRVWTRLAPSVCPTIYLEQEEEKKETTFPPPLRSNHLERRGEERQEKFVKLAKSNRNYSDASFIRSFPSPRWKGERFSSGKGERRENGITYRCRVIGNSRARASLNSADQPRHTDA